LRVLAESRNFSRLATLDLSYNKIRDEGVRILSQSANLSSLTNLDLSYNLNWICKDAAHTLANSECLGRLTHLRMSRDQIEVGGLQILQPRSDFFYRIKNLEIEIYFARL